MSIDAYIKIGSIKGECSRDKVKDWIELTGWSWTGTAETNVHMAKGAGVGKSTIEDLSFTYLYDTSVPVLLDHLATGTHVDKAELIQRKAGGTQMPFIILTLENVFVTNLEQSASSDGLPEVTCQLAFGKYTLEYQPQDKTGAKKGGVIKSAYDIAKTKAM